MQTFETTRPLKVRLEELAKKRGITVSALIREILERHFEERNDL
jgi:predicted DNA-binding protein